MADNVAITAGSGTTIASDDVSGVQYQRIKVTDGTADSNTHLKVCAEDAAHSSGDTGLMALGVRVDTGASLAATDGDYVPMQFDSTGNLRVRVAATDTSATLTDDSAFTPATSKVVAIAATADDSSTDSVDEGDAGAVRMTPNRRLIVTPYESEAVHAQAYASVTSTTSTALTAFGATSGKYNYVTSLVIYNSSATDTFVQIQDGNGGTTFAVIPAPTKGGTAVSFAKPLKQPTVNTALYFATANSVSTVYVTAIGYQA